MPAKRSPAKRSPAKRSPAKKSPSSSTKITLLRIVPSPIAGKKWRAVFRRQATQRDFTRDFGAEGMSDYTLHHDKERRARYRQRHARDLRTGDPTRAGYLSAEILWGDSTSFARNVAAYKRKHGF
jgi:hypothetical protein